MEGDWEERRALERPGSAPLHGRALQPDLLHGVVGVGTSHSEDSSAVMRPVASKSSGSDPVSSAQSIPDLYEEGSDDR